MQKRTLSRSPAQEPMDGRLVCPWENSKHNLYGWYMVDLISCFRFNKSTDNLCSWRTYILFATYAVQHLHVRQKNTLVKRPVVGDQCTTGIGCNQVSQVIQPSHLL
jgi:hypothetical protein